MSFPRSLASLPDVVLREVLAYLLVDTPRKRNRAAILRTCSTLHELGLPILFRVVDITSEPEELVPAQLVVRIMRSDGSFTDEEITSEPQHTFLMPSRFDSGRSVSHWTDLFDADRGLLTSDGRIRDLGQSVVHLKIGGAANDSFYAMLGEARSTLGKVALPNCTRLTLGYRKGLPEYIKQLLPRVPVVDLIITFGNDPELRRPIDWCKPSKPLDQELGLLRQVWDNLRSITFKGTVWIDQVADSYQHPMLFGITNQPITIRVLGPQLSLAHWSYKLLVIDLRDWDGDRTRPDEWANIRLCLLYPPSRQKQAKYLDDVERIELRVGPGMEQDLEEEMGAVRRKSPVDPVRGRILRLIVFVGPEEGEERRLIESAE